MAGENSTTEPSVLSCLKTRLTWIHVNPFLFSREDLVAALNDAIDRREEGLMVKHPGATYRPDKRKGRKESFYNFCVNILPIYMCPSLRKRLG